MTYITNSGEVLGVSSPVLADRTRYELEQSEVQSYDAVLNLSGNESELERIIGSAIVSAAEIASEAWDVTGRPTSEFLKRAYHSAKAAYLNGPAVKYFDFTPKGIRDATVQLFKYMTVQPEDSSFVAFGKRLAGAATAFAALC